MFVTNFPALKKKIIFTCVYYPCIYCRPQPYLRQEQFSFSEKDYVSSYGHATDELSDKCSEKWCMSHSTAYGIPPDIILGCVQTALCIHTKILKQ